MWIYDELDKIMPLEKYSDYLCGKIQNEFDPNCKSVKIYHLQLNIPNDFGRIPTMQELKNDINLYRCSYFTITLNSDIDENDKDNYKNKLKNYLENNTKYKWSIYYNNNGTISCSG